MDANLQRMLERLDGGELTAAVAAEAYAALGRAEVLLLAGNEREAREVVAEFLKATEFKPMVDVAENGNVAMLELPALATLLGNSRADGAPFVDVHGLRVVVENAAGSERTGTTKDGGRWAVTMPCDYGYICSADGVGATTGADGDGVDCFLGRTPSGTVFVIDQSDLATGEFDEHKCMVDFKDRAEALRYYAASYSDGKGRERVMGVKPMALDDFKAWLRTAKTKVQAANAGYASRPDLEHEEQVRRHSERIFRAALQAQLDQAERDAALARRKRKRDDDEAALLLALVASPAFLSGLPAQLRNAASAAYQWSAQALALPPEGPFPALGGAQGAFEQLKAAKGHADSREPLYRKAAEGVRQRLQQSIARGVAGGESPQALRRRFEEALRQEAEAEGKLLGETESQVIYGVTQSAALRAAGFTHKRWVSVGDDRVRHSHVQCDAQGAIPAESPFANGLMYPGDPNGPASEVVNCRCHLEGARA